MTVVNTLSKVPLVIVSKSCLWIVPAMKWISIEIFGDKNLKETL